MRDPASPRAEARVDGKAGVAVRWRVALANRQFRASSGSWRGGAGLLLTGRGFDHVRGLNQRSANG